jgi:hypothetical protein
MKIILSFVCEVFLFLIKTLVIRLQDFSDPCILSRSDAFSVGSFIGEKQVFIWKNR